MEWLVVSCCELEEDVSHRSSSPSLSSSLLISLSLLLNDLRTRRKNRQNWAGSKGAKGKRMLQIRSWNERNEGDEHEEEKRIKRRKSHSFQRFLGEILPIPYHSPLFPLFKLFLSLTDAPWWWLTQTIIEIENQSKRKEEPASIDTTSSDCRVNERHYFSFLFSSWFREIISSFTCNKRWCQIVFLFIVNLDS